MESEITVMNLPLRSTGSHGPRRRRLWKMLRSFLPGSFRFFYEGHPDLPGQFWYAERRLLYGAVRRYRPLNCFEIGTWYGGGSTFFTASALNDNGAGILHTIEVNPTMFSRAVAAYQTHLPELLPFVDFSCGDYRTVFPPILCQATVVDLLVLDGPEDAVASLDQYQFFLPWLRKGAVVIQHDWYSEKSRLVKPLLTDSAEWDIVKVLSPPCSLGMAVALRK